MTSNPVTWVELTLNLAAAYLVQSTLLLCGVGLVLRCVRAGSPFLTERLWKTAAVLPLLTAPLQVALARDVDDAAWVICLGPPVATVESTTGIHPGRDQIAGDRESNKPAQQKHLKKPGVDAGNGRVALDAATSGHAPSSARSQPVAAASNSSPSRAPKSRGDQVRRRNRPARKGDGRWTVRAKPKFVRQESGSVTDDQIQRPETLPSTIRATTSPTTGGTRELSNSGPSQTTNSGIAQVSDNPRALEVQDSPARRYAAIAASGLTLCVLLGLFRLMLRHWLFRRRLYACANLVDGDAYQLLDGLRSNCGTRRRVLLCESDRFTEPVACGAIRWRIVLPTGFDRQLDHAQLRATLAHELAHLVRGDTVWLWLGHLLTSCFWFQPLNLIARKNWQHAAEFLCDAWAVRESKVNPLTLAQSLTQIAGWRLDDRTDAAMLTATGSRSTLGSRVKQLVDYGHEPDAWQSRRRRRWLMASLLILLPTVVLVSPRAALTDSASDSQKGMRDGKSSTAIADVADHNQTARESSGTTAPAEPKSTGRRKVMESGMRPGSVSRGSTDRPQLLSEWTRLQQELQQLNFDLIRVSELLEQRPNSPRVLTFARRVRERAQQLEQRRAELQRLLFPPNRLSQGSSNVLRSSAEPHSHSGEPQNGVANNDVNGFDPDTSVRPAGVPDRVSSTDRTPVLSLRETDS